MSRKYCLIVVDDKCFTGEAKDVTGEAIKKAMRRFGFDFEGKFLIPHNQEMVESALLHCADNLKVPLILTFGGTGFSLRHQVPEATKAVITKEAPGIAEAIRSYALESSDLAMLNRGVAGIRNKSLIVNLPDGEKAAREALEVCIETVKLGIDIMLGE
ncbi:MAG: MogA/MoaB family molybdenum cofactor biosynthesis protein [Clostridiales bacterium]|jgi:molybdopterin adenylyltransferase|nr:MogA/MoaB family molybdenum cofactor biosynthesis protein [Clostridiales bacterium]